MPVLFCKLLVANTGWWLWWWLEIAWKSLHHVVVIALSELFLFTVAILSVPNYKHTLELSASFGVCMFVWPTTLSWFKASIQCLGIVIDKLLSLKSRPSVVQMRFGFGYNTIFWWW